MTDGTRDAILERLDEAQVALLSVAADDMPRLARILSRLEEARDLAREAAAAPEAQSALAAARDAAERIIFDEAGPFPAAQSALSALVAALAGHFRDGLPAASLAPAVAALSGGAPPPPAGGMRLDVSDLTGEFAAGKLHALEEFEAAALALERAWSEERRKEIMRIVHTMKGEAAVLGFAELETFCHEFEDYLERVGRGISIEFALRARDALKIHLESIARGRPAPLDPRLLPDLMLLKSRPAADAPGEPAAAAGEADETPPVFTRKPGLIEKLKSDEFMVREFHSSTLEHLEAADQLLVKLERDPNDRASLDAVFRSFHTVKGMSSFLELDDLTTLAHEAENLFQKARDGDIVLSGYAVDLVFLTVDCLRGMVQSFLAAFEAGRDPEVSAKAPGLILSLRKAGRRRAAAEVITPPAAPAAEEGEPRPAPAGGAPDAGEAAKGAESVKVDAKKLDHLADTIGELVIVESMVVNDEELARHGSDRLAKNLSHLGKICRELQEMAMQLRMVPLKATFQKMARVARDVAKKLGKRIDLVIAGEETEIDRMLAERIHDPLIHMIRNAVDHGIERTVEERIARGKRPEGTVRLSARHEGGKIIIEVADDGAGLDRARILEKAREKGLVGPDADAMGDDEVYALVFAPGFSTAERVSDVSGRGVGMDVVRKNIEELRGRVEIRSERGQGSAFKIVLPLTLAIIDGMIVRTGDRRFILPTLSIVESIRRAEVAVTPVRGGAGRMFRLRGRLLPLFDLADYFRFDRGAASGEGIVVVLDDFGTRAGVEVDELVGQQQIVIKSIHGLPGETAGIAGGAILADGSVGLIVDVAALLRDLVRAGADSGGGGGA